VVAVAEAAAIDVVGTIVMAEAAEAEAVAERMAVVVAVAERNSRRSR